MRVRRNGRYAAALCSRLCRALTTQKEGRERGSKARDPVDEDAFLWDGVDRLCVTTELPYERTTTRRSADVVTPSPFVRPDASFPTAPVKRTLDKTLAVWSSDPNYPNPRAPRAYIDFRRLDDPREILVALETSQDFLQMRQIVAALARCRSAGIALHPDALRAVLVLAERTIDSTRPEDVVGLFLSCSRFKFTHRPALLDAVARMAIDRGFVKELTLREIATLVHACASLLRRAARSLGSRLRDEAQTRAATSKGVTGFEDHGEFVSGMADVESLLDVLIEEIAILRQLNGELELRLPSMMRSLSYLGRKDRRLERLVERMGASLTRIEGLCEDRVAALIFALASCERVEQEVVDRVATEVTKRERLAAFSATQLIGILRAFSELRPRSLGLWITVLWETTQSSRLHELTSKQLSILMKAIVTSAAAQDEAILIKVAKEALSEERMRELSTETALRRVALLRNVDYSLAVEGQPVAAKIHDPRALYGLKPVELVGVIEGLKRLRFPGGETTLERLTEETLDLTGTPEKLLAFLSQYARRKDCRAL